MPRSRKSTLNKPVSNKSISELINDTVKHNPKPVVKGEESEMKEVYLYQDVFSPIPDSEVVLRNQYNKILIHNIPDTYNNFTPSYGNVLVRVFARPFKKEFSIYKDFAPKVKIMSESGRGHIDYVLNPYAYSLKAIVVSSKDLTYPKGTIVQLSPSAINVVAPIPNNKSYVVPIAAFVHADTEDISFQNIPPKHLTSNEFGFLLVPMSEIVGVIKEVNHETA